MQPSNYGLPHSDWRKGQCDTVQKYLSIERGDTLITEQPTGSGKSATAMAVASQHSIVALTETKALQRAYESLYDADIVMGKANYDCIHPEYRGRDVGDCPFNERGMNKCPMFGQCEYIIAKHKAQESPKAVLNYHYYLAVRDRWPVFDYLVLDEVHLLSKLVVEYAGVTITHRQQKTWGLSDFPELKPSTGGGMLTKVVDPLPVAMGWLEDTRSALRRHWTSLKHASTERELKRKRKCEQLGRKVGSTLDALRRCPDDWYIKSGRRGQKFGREWRPAMVVRPLTARHHAPGYFLDGHASILMSATVGDFGTFAGELGIEKYDSLVIPNQYTAAERPVYVLDVPSMGAKASESAFECQADAIAEGVLGCPDEWSGIVHVTRKRESRLLADRLARRGLQDRVWVPPGADEGTYEPTDRQVAAWENRKAKVSNSIVVSWSMWTGFDGLDERICISAKVPYPVWGSGGSYEAAWRGYDMKRYRWQAANMLAQGLGRTRRGRDGDYDIDGRFAGFVALADGSYNQVKGSLPQDLRDALVE